MLKCILIYLWIYIGLYYVIEAADADEHVHIKLHMPSGQRKHTHHHTHHHKKRHHPQHYHSTSTSTHQRGARAPTPPAPPPPPTTHLYHETPQNYLQQQNNNIKTLPSHLHESGQLQVEELADVYNSDSSGGTDNEDTESSNGEHMMIPSYLAENFALFPQPSIKTTYETDIIPQNIQGFQHNHQPHSQHRPHNMVELTDEEEDNEITSLGGEDIHGGGTVMLAEEAENYHSHKPFAQELSSSSSKLRQKEQLLQQILQQQEIINAAKFRGNKYRTETDYHSEDDMTETGMMTYSSEPGHIPTSTRTTFTRETGEDGNVGHTGIKALTVDDIWSQLQRQYLNKYVPQAQAISSDDLQLSSTATTKKKRTTKRQRQRAASLPTTSSNVRQATSSFWPAKTSNYDNNHYHQQKLQYDDNHSTSLPASFFSSPSPSFSSSRDTDLFDDTRALRRPYNQFNGHNLAATTATLTFGGSNNGASDEDSLDEDGGGENFFNHDNVDDIEEDSHDTSLHEQVYQRGKKFIENTGHVAYGHSNTNNPFNYHDLYASYSTPVTATVATKIYPSTYHPKLTKPTATSSSSSASSSLYDSILPTLSHESTSYQWHTQQHNNPVSYQSYHLQHQEQPQQHQQQHQLQQQHHPIQQQQQHHYRQQHPQSSALRLPKATITQMPSTVSTSTSSLSSPTMSNDFTSADKSTIQPSRYKKRKNRIKTKRNRIVVI